MKLQRSIMNDLIAWKKQDVGRTALLVEGARRVGKSTIAKRFASEQYRSYVLINFEEASKAMRANFEENLTNLDVFFQNIAIEHQVPLYKRETLIIFDEVQLFPLARQAIKQLVQDGRYDYLETGSLISIRENVRNILIPSEEISLHMYPLTFPEFLVAAQEEQLLEHIRTCFAQRTPLAEHLHKRAARLMREYMLVGGMPQSVVAYFENNRNFGRADKEKRQIIHLYRSDIQKISNVYRSKVANLFNYLPGFLSTHEKKITLAKIDKGAKFSRYDDPLYWLDDSMICNLCYRCADPNMGLALTLDTSQVKCYMGDTGLLVSLAFSEHELTSQEIYRKIIQGRLSLNEGMLHENLVAQTIASFNQPLYFYSHYAHEQRRNDIEIDFLLPNGTSTNPRIDPVEVKSAKNYTKTSFNTFRKRFGKRIGKAFIVHPKGLVETNTELRVPTYMWFCVLEELTA